MDFSYFLASRLGGNDTLRLASREERGYFIRLNCYSVFYPAEVFREL